LPGPGCWAISGAGAKTVDAKTAANKSLVFMMPHSNRQFAASCSSAGRAARTSSCSSRHA